jgi:hypothetical protein
LDLSAQGSVIKYLKWGDTQTAKQGDWLLNNAGEVYTVDKESFEKTYTQLSPGQYVKSGVYAAQAIEAGSIQTKEGTTHYAAGSWLLYNNEDGTDGYAVTDEKFRKLYLVD